MLGSLAGSANDFDGCVGEGPEEVLRWTPPAPGRYVIDTVGSRFDTVLYVATELRCDEPVSPAQCNDDFGGMRSLMTVDNVAGEDVFIVVDGYNSAVGDYVLNFRGVSACPATELGVDLGLVLYRVSDFVNEAGVLAPDGIASCGGGSVGMTFSWRAPETGTYRISTDGSAFDTVLALREGCGGPLLSCDDDSSSLAVNAAEIIGAFDAQQQVVIELGAFRRDEMAEEFGGAVLNIEKQ